MYLRVLLLLIIISGAFYSHCQQDSTAKKLQFTGDFRFRIEHDWNSRKQDGSYRQDRSRLRYRMRFGMSYQVLPWAQFGARVRTGNITDQQGPHITLGGNNGEAGLVQVGFEKVYFKAHWENFSFWAGKNTFPFVKKNELFWNDNVYPEGLAFQWKQPFESTGISEFGINAGHFVMASRGGTFDMDAYLSAFQLSANFFDNHLEVYPGIFYFNQMNCLPDGMGNYMIDYAIFQGGATVNLLEGERLRLSYDYYHNFNKSINSDSIPTNLRNQNQGHVVSVKYGHLKEKGDWTIEIYGAILEKYAIVDYFAQNDWVRWDYRGQGASGSRISNFQGIELRAGYAFSPNFDLILRAYWVEQLVTQGTALENGSRIRLDLNIGF